MFFRLGMHDLMVGVGNFFIAGLASPAILGDASNSPAGFAVTAGCGSLLYLITAPPLYRALCMRPMHFPKCPHCETKEGCWGVPAGSTPMQSEDLVCGSCGAATTFIYAANSADGAPPSKPTFVLRWPRPFGLWRRVH